MSGFACPDWWEKLRAGETPLPDLVLDETRADVAVELFNKLRVPDIPGQPTFGEVGGEWVRDLVRAAFGSVDADTGQRTVGEIFNLIPKKNGKTTNAAALGILALQMNQTPNIEGSIIGPTQEVADLCFAQAVAMIRADSWLNDRFNVIEHRKTIVDMMPHPETRRPMNARLKVKSFDPSVVTGSIPAFSIIDELHLMAAKDYAHRVIGQIRGGMITNPQSLLIFITTQSEEPPAGVFLDELTYARKVRDGVITDNVRMLPMLYEFPAEMQRDEAQPWKDPENWGAVLPNLGRSIDLARLVPFFEKAVATSDVELARWASQHLNIQIGMGHHLGQWVGAEHWPGAAVVGLTLERIKAECSVVVVGIDGGGMDDLLGLSVIGRHRDNGQWWAWGHAWAHPVVLERRKNIASKLRDLEASGGLTICEDPTQDIEEITAHCADLAACGLLPEKGGIGLDPEGVAAILDALEAEGLAETLIGVSQGYKLNSAIKGAERKLFDGTLRHGGQEIMTWCVSNARAEPRGNAIMVTKAVSGTAKIDPLMAMFNAVTLMSKNPVAANGAATPWDLDPEYRMTA